MKNETLPALTGSHGHIPDLISDGYSNSEPEEEAKGSGLNLHEVLFILFRHKWKILLCTAIGMLGAAVAYFFLPPVYQSDAKLFVRYVVDKSAIDGLDSQIKTPNPQTDTVVNSEVEILSSSDLAQQVVQAMGIDRFSPSGESKVTTAKAIEAFFSGLDISL